jgi:hypothetical protein
MSLNISLEEFRDLLSCLMNANAAEFSTRQTTRSQPFSPTSSGHLADIYNDANDQTIDDEDAIGEEAVRRWLKGEALPTRRNFERLINSFPIIPDGCPRVINKCLRKKGSMDRDNDTLYELTEEEPNYGDIAERHKKLGPGAKKIVSDLIDDLTPKRNAQP